MMWRLSFLVISALVACQVVGLRVKPMEGPVSVGKESCSKIIMQRNTRVEGKFVMNIEMPLPNISNTVADVACDIAHGQVFSVTTNGPSKKYKDQMVYIVTVYERATAKLVPGNSTTWAAVAPFIPTPAPPPSCKSFGSNFSACPNYCAWVKGHCEEDTPIECADLATRNFTNNAPFCLNVVVLPRDPFNSSALPPAKPLRTFNGTLVQVTDTTHFDVNPAPELSNGESSWWSIHDGFVHNASAPHGITITPFGTCLTYQELSSTPAQFVDKELSIEGGNPKSGTWFKYCMFQSGGELDINGPVGSKDLGFKARFMTGGTKYYAQLMVWPKQE